MRKKTQQEKRQPLRWQRRGRRRVTGRGAQSSGDNDNFIREMLELFNGKLIETGRNELKSREFWSFSIDSVTEETDE